MWELIMEMTMARKWGRILIWIPKIHGSENSQEDIKGNLNVVKEKSWDVYLENGDPKRKRLSKMGQAYDNA